MLRPRHLAGALALTAVLATAACGEQTPAAVTGRTADVAVAGSASGSTSSGSTRTGGASGAASSPEPRAERLDVGETKPVLTCPTDDRSMMIADFAQGAEGASTPQGAVGRGLVQAGERLVISASGRTAWVLRPDGTARMEIGLLHDDGWRLHMRTSCG